MGNARIVRVSDLATRFNYELRNTHQKQWEEAETLEYANKWLEYIHHMLAEHESDLVKTGSGSFTTQEGEELYDLTAKSMGDLFYPVTVWLGGIAELELASEADRMPHVIAKEQGANAYSQPISFYLEGDKIGLLPFPDSTTYTVNIKYVPDFTPLTAMTNPVPFKNLFNNVLVEGVKIIAKNREEYGTSVDAALMDLFQDRVMSILRKRQKQEFQLTPYFG